MSTAGPTQRTMVWLREQGYTVEKVEYRLRFSKTTVDFCGFADLIAFQPLTGEFSMPGILAVQVTTTAHVAERVAKVLAESRAAIWRAAGGHIWVVGWALRGDQGKRKLWTPKVVSIDDTTVEIP